MFCTRDLSCNQGAFSFFKIIKIFLYLSGTMGDVEMLSHLIMNSLSLYA